MADKPILFSPPMVRALLAGRKTQTRRAMRLPRGVDPEHYTVSSTWIHPRRGVEFTHWPADDYVTSFRLPPYMPGDRLYVREAWNSDVNADTMKPSELLFTQPIWYFADGKQRGGTEYSLRSHRFRQAMHMPRWASRMTLDVSEVRVQRLHDISDDDCRAEGIQQTGRFFYVEEDDDWDDAHLSPRLAYFGLLDKLNGAGFADSNPWLTATTFTVQMGNIDEIAA